MGKGWYKNREMMTKTYRREYLRTPLAPHYMALALLPKKGFKNTQDLPEITAVWKNCKPGVSSAETFARLTGLRCATVYQPLFLHTISSRLLMSVLAHPAFPEAIWRFLQIRNIIIQHRALCLDEPFDISVSIAGHRILQKGLEVDLHVDVSTFDDVVLESTTTFYHRGNFGDPDTIPASRTPETVSQIHSTWSLADNESRAFGSLTGDFNGIHRWNWYAKMFGFKMAFSHPQRILGQILKRLCIPDDLNTTSKTEIWLKGPVYYGSTLELRAVEKKEEILFNLHVNGDHRPAIAGRYVK